MAGKESQRKRDRRQEAFDMAEKYRKKDQSRKDPKARGGVALHKKAYGGAECGAQKKKDSKAKCKLAAGWGTPHPGVGACKYHGGCVPSHVKAAASEEYRRLLGTEMEINPYEGIMWCIKIRAGEVKWLGDRMAELDEEAWVEETLVGKQFHLYARERKDAMRDLTRYCEMALRLGIAERYVRLAETYGQLIAQLIKRILEKLNLTDEQKLEAPKIVRQELLAIEGGGQDLLEAATATKEAA
jgi:hypothetical protein